MACPIYTITPDRLRALSPTARALAEDAIRFGLWQLIETDFEGKKAESKQ